MGCNHNAYCSACGAKIEHVKDFEMIVRNAETTLDDDQRILLEVIRQCGPINSTELRAKAAGLRGYRARSRVGPTVNELLLRSLIVRADSVEGERLPRYTAVERPS